MENVELPYEGRTSSAGIGNDIVSLINGPNRMQIRFLVDDGSREHLHNTSTTSLTIPTSESSHHAGGAKASSVLL